jgi:hypothetical protein
LPAFGGRNVAASRGLTGLAAAPLVSRFNQRASFHVSAAADGEDGYDGDSGGGGPVKLYVGNLSWGVSLPPPSRCCPRSSPLHYSTRVIFLPLERKTLNPQNSGFCSSLKPKPGPRILYLKPLPVLTTSEAWHAAC